MDTQPNLVVNLFGIELKQKVIYRHLVHIKLFQPATATDFILTTVSFKGRGNRVSKIIDNHLIARRMMEDFAKKDSRCIAAKRAPAIAYDGGGLLFSTVPINVCVDLSTDEACAIPGLSNYLKDSLQFMEGSIVAFIKPDVDKPSFCNETEWKDSRFCSYLDIVTSQYAVETGKYVSHSRGLYLHTQMKENSKVDWAYTAHGVHKSCRIVGVEKAMPVLELDPRTIQHFQPCTLDHLVLKVFGRIPQNRNVNMHSFYQRMERFLRGLRCNPYYADIDKWATTTQMVTGIDHEAQKKKEYQQKFPNLRYPDLPAAICGTSHRKIFPLEYLKILPYSTLDKQIVSEFDLIPKAMPPEERWRIGASHFAEFKFHNPQRVSALKGERVDAPAVKYAARQVRVDDEKRDWKPFDAKFVEAGRIDYFVTVIILSQSRNPALDQKMTSNVMERFFRRCAERGLGIRENIIRCYDPQNRQNPADFLTIVFADVLDHIRGRSIEPFVFLVSDDVPNIHEFLKFEERISDIPTQHVLIKSIRSINDTLMKGKMSQTMENIILKTNVKAGGINYIADIPDQLASWNHEPPFVIGLDVSHPDKPVFRDRVPSTVGLSCNSGDSSYTFIGDFAFTTPRRESVDPVILRKFVTDNFRKFVRVRGFPKRVYIFRDGVSCGEESEAVIETNVISDAIVEAAEEEGARGYAPLVLSIVVKKRHNTRFYLNRNNQPKNPLADTAVGGIVAEYGKRQIFIQAFRPIQGTAKIPSFLVIRDDENIDDEYLTKMVCAICSLHQIVNAPTSIPTPVFVSHEFAKRGSDLLRAYKLKTNQLSEENDLTSLTAQLSYSACTRLSKIRVV
ncbi:unnamed protein product [Caenorhabditis auriculariae]|uniref:Piwi domain-containing protein n=1 Tax=Caenorhabditis auriculariae TaxID=2777116 RepID=A0A8S1GT66_9PELO|nr:unnamed protein product [Caenorhabditis auriculariae]